MIFIACGGDNLFCSILRRMMFFSRAKTQTPRFSINYRYILEWPSDWRSVHLFDGVDKRAQLAQPADHSRSDPRGCFDFVGQVELQATRCLARQKVHNRRTLIACVWRQGQSMLTEPFRSGSWSGGFSLAANE
jgi:hypothetical protein